MKNVSNLLPRLEFFRIYKGDLKVSECRTDASVELMSCITVIDFWSDRIQNLMN